jgi:hypothetical protein
VSYFSDRINKRTADVEPEQNAAENQTPVSGVDDIAAAVAESASEPNEQAMQALRESQLQAAPVVRSISTVDASDATDTKGNKFDPSQHMTNADGSPKLYNGKLRRKKGASASVVSTVGTQTPATPSAPTQAPSPDLTPAQRHAARLAGAKAADGFLLAAKLIGGAEFTPIKNGKFEDSGPDGMPDYDERKMFHDAFGAVAEHYRMTQFSPIWDLVLVMSLYVGGRAFMPDTRTRLQKAKSWVYSKIGSIWGRRNAARSNSRNDNKREIDPSVESRESGSSARA